MKPGFRHDAGFGALGSFAAPAVGVALGAIVSLVSGSASAVEIRIDGDCRSGMHVVARDVRLSEVLRKLAAKLDFELVFDSQSDPLLTVDAVYHPVELLTRLAPTANLSIMTQVQDLRCRPLERVVKVWVLPSYNDGAGKASAPETLAREARARSQDPADANGVDMVLKAHGLDANGQFVSHD